MSVRLKGYRTAASKMMLRLHAIGKLSSAKVLKAGPGLARVTASAAACVTSPFTGKHHVMKNPASQYTRFAPITPAHNRLGCACLSSLQKTQHSVNRPATTAIGIKSDETYAADRAGNITSAS